MSFNNFTISNASTNYEQKSIILSKEEKYEKFIKQHPQVQVTNQDKTMNNIQNQSLLNQDLINLNKKMQNLNSNQINNNNSNKVNLTGNNILSFDVSNFSYSVHLFAAVTRIVASILITSWETITDNGSFKKIHLNTVVKILKYKTFLIKNLILLFNDAWNGTKQTVIEEGKIKSIYNYGNFKHDFCCFHVVFELCKDVLNAVLDSLNAETVYNETVFRQFTDELIDKVLAQKYDSVIRRNSKYCICGAGDNEENGLSSNINETYNSSIRLMVNKSRSEQFIFISEKSVN